MDVSLARTTVLLIDPHKEDREYWTQRLNVSSPDYVVLEADTGKAGLLLCRQQRVDCVLVELALPDMSGFEVLVKLVPRARHPEIAVIVLTRLALHPMADLAIKNGAQEYLVKPHISGDDLDWAIQKAMFAVAFKKAEHR
ncbi:MAG TPA: response regulator [Nitrospira sp.]|nr:response regulator [Nitrospira sp.]